MVKRQWKQKGTWRHYIFQTFLNGGAYWRPSTAKMQESSSKPLEHHEQQCGHNTIDQGVNQSYGTIWARCLNRRGASCSRRALQSGRRGRGYGVSSRLSWWRNSVNVGCVLFGGDISLIVLIAQLVAVGQPQLLRDLFFLWFVLIALELADKLFLFIDDVCITLCAG
jgi:hypothetical protein